MSFTHQKEVHSCQGVGMDVLGMLYYSLSVSDKSIWDCGNLIVLTEGRSWLINSP